MARLKVNLYAQVLRTCVRLSILHSCMTTLTLASVQVENDFMQASYLTTLSDTLAIPPAPLPSTLGAKAVEAHIIPALLIDEQIPLKSY